MLSNGRKHGKTFRQVAALLIILLLMSVIGCEAKSLGMSLRESFVVVGFMGISMFLATMPPVQRIIRRRTVPRLTDTSTDKEAKDLLDLFDWDADAVSMPMLLKNIEIDLELEMDLERWFNEGGS